VSSSRSAFLYEGPVRRALMRLKFSGWRSAAEAFAPWMAVALGRAPPEAVVTWVPLGRRRKRQRGFDQAEALARAVARRTGLRARRMIERRAETAPQARRGGVDRRLALRGAFRAVGGSPPVVILVDDVLTSGSTAAACAEVLRDAGAERVLVLTAARALGSGVPTRCYGRVGRSGCVRSPRRV